MTQYLLSVHTTQDGCGPSPSQMSQADMQAMMQKVNALESEMKSEGAWLFGGKLHQPDTATVVQMADGKMLTTDGPFAESKEHLGGFYIIQAKDLDAALSWASKVTECVGRPIEVRPFWDAPGG